LCAAWQIYEFFKCFSTKVLLNTLTQHTQVGFSTVALDYLITVLLISAIFVFLLICLQLCSGFIIG